MSNYYSELAAKLAELLGEQNHSLTVEYGELTLEIDAADLETTCLKLRDTAELKYEQLIDLCGIDYSEYLAEGKPASRFGVIYHLLSTTLNHRLRLKTLLPDDDFPMISSVVTIWNSANWYEREAFDLFGIIFEGHPDLRRILTDYGFIGHPFRKDFPMLGNVEMRYDSDKGRVVYEPVKVEYRENIPKVVRHDHRYADRVEQADLISGQDNG